MLGQYLIIQYSIAKPIKATFVSLFTLAVFMLGYLFQSIFCYNFNQHSLFLSCVIQVHSILKTAAVSVIWQHFFFVVCLPTL